MTAPVDSLFLSLQEALAGRYSLERELGRGGMGVVYLARDVRLDRRVAIKLLPPEFAANASLRDRFLREARTAARLSHPYIVPIHAVDEIGDFVFIVMAYVEGETLAQRVATRGPVAAAELTRILREMAWALAYAHAQGVVHRDVKPANILLEAGTGRAVITDFGIARVSDTSGGTSVGELLGTPEFMSPEQASGEEVDGRSDLYALGAVGYFALTGSTPFSAPTVQAVLAQHITKPAPPVTALARGVPRALAQSIDRCFAKDREARFETGEALAAALETALEKRADVPIPVRVFLDRRRLIWLVVPPALTVSLVLPIWASVLRSAEHPGRLSIPLGMAALFGLAAPFVGLVTRLRALLRLGYGPDDLVAALRASFHRRREEFLFEFGLQPSRREKGIRIISVALLSVLAGSAVPAFFNVNARLFSPLAIVSFYNAVLFTGISERWRRLRRRTESFWANFWSGPAGRGLARIAAYRLGDRAVAADRPTEVAIALSAEAMYQSLSKELRESLGDVTPVLHALEADAGLARAQIEELSAKLDAAQLGPKPSAAADHQQLLVADFTAARARAETRLADLVTALETLRLDLLRLSAGAGSVESITLDLEAARNIGDQTNRVLEGARVVERSLAKTT